MQKSLLGEHEGTPIFSGVPAVAPQNFPTDPREDRAMSMFGCPVCHDSGVLQLSRNRRHQFCTCEAGHQARLRSQNESSTHAPQVDDLPLFS
jgi:hypothetical protein